MRPAEPWRSPQLIPGERMRWLSSYNVALIVMEATGKLQRKAHEMLHNAGFAVAVVNPLRSRLFAEAVGRTGQD